MTPNEIKTFLIDNGLTVADIARELQSDFPDVKYLSIYSMVNDMIYRRNYYPKYANKVRDRFGIVFERPDFLRSTRELAKKVA